MKIRDKSLLLIIPIVILAAFLLFFQLGNNYLVNWDEAWFASVAKDALKNGDYLNGRWNGETWFYEPPLLTWILSFVLKFSQSNFWLRFFNALSALLIVIITFLFASKITKNYLCGFFSAMILVSSIEFLFRGRQINTEIPLSLFLLISVYSAYMITVSKKGYWLFLMSASLGLALLTKRATTLLILPSIAYLLYQYKPRIFKTKSVYMAILLLVLIALPWYILNFFKWGLLFWQEFFVGATLNKITAVNQVAGSSSLFYPKSIAYSFKLFSPVLYTAIAWLVIFGIKDKKIKFLSVYFATFGIILTFVSLKASWYLVPAYPIFAVICGIFILQLINFFPKIKNITIASLIFVTLFQLYYWRIDYIVPDTSSHQAKLAIHAKNLSDENDVVYLDDFWTTVAAYYSERKIIPIRFSRVKEISNYIDIPKGSLVLTNQETFGNLEDKTNGKYQIIEREGDLLLIRAI